MGTKYSYEFVKNTFESDGYRLLDVAYKNNVTPLNVVCPKGHKTTSTMANFLKGKRCKYCAGIVQDVDMVKNAFTAAGYTMLEDYVKAHRNIKIICNKGHHTEITWTVFQSGGRCRVCAGTQPLDKEIVKKSFEYYGYELLEDYKRYQDPIKFRCPEGHIHQIAYKHWVTGSRCYFCTKHLSPNFVKSEFEKESYILHDTYTRSNAKLRFTCPTGHNNSMPWDSWQKGHRCISCNQNGGFNPNKPATLYYIRFTVEGKSYYKIGITNRTVGERFSSDRLQYTIIHSKTYIFGSMAYEEEQAILKKYAKYKYKGHPILDSGNTELFTRDVLKLDREITAPSNAQAMLY
ncbi:MAG: hypothetical protein KME47_10075 [Nodosilinea sp. WJT8-NPBG4]|jgi:hypothetical protein|nr:hypothetical protein [Nodosilinea sp. WJT8-NPBG4]